MSVKKKMYRMKYAGSRGKGVVIKLPFDPRKGKCDACGRRVGEGIKVTALHHWWYAYKPSTVKKNPALALENTSELCYGCHQVADAIRALLYANPQRVARVVRCLEGDQKNKFIKRLAAVIEVFNKTEKDISPIAKNILRMLE